MFLPASTCIFWAACVLKLLAAALDQIGSIVEKVESCLGVVAFVEVRVFVWTFHYYIFDFVKRFF